MPAYSVLEDCENTGGIVFARNSRQARRLGANEFNGGDQDGVNRAGELPVSVVLCERSGRGLPVYPGQSAAAVAARLGAKDYVVEPVGGSHG